MCIIYYSIKETLWDYSPICTKALDDNYEFEEFSILTQASDRNPLRSVLYIALQPDPELFCSCGRKVTILCSGTKKDYTQYASLSCSVILLQKTADMADVINRLMSFRYKIQSWKASMECAIAAGTDLQGLLDISEPFFHDPIIIMSKTLKVLAYTRNIPAPHPDVADTIRNGFFPRHMVRGLIENNYLEAAESFYEIGYHYPPNYIGCTKIIKVYHENVLQAHTICLYGLSGDVTPDTMYRMKVLTRAIQELISKAGTISSLSSRSTCVLAELLAQELPEEDLAGQAALLEWNADHTYELYCVEFARFFYPYMQFVVNCLQTESSFLYVFPLDRQIVVVREISTVDSEDRDMHLYHWMEPLLNENNAYLGTSDQFQDLASFRIAWKQASATARIGSVINPGKAVYRYVDYYAYTLMDICGKEIPLEKLYCRKLNALREFDSKDKTNDLELLEVLLRNERNITAVAKELYLHRNTVIYRVHKLEERLGLSLNDPSIRLMLQLSIMILHLCRVQGIDTPEQFPSSPDIISFDLTSARTS